MQNLLPANASALTLWLDRAAITQVAQDWGLARDDGRWSQLRECYTSDAVMHTTWFVGPAAEFVERSIESASRGARVQHFIGATTIALNGDKAVAETRMILMVRGRLDGVEVDATCWGRFHDRFVKRDDQWRIHKRVPVYEKDRLDPVDPAATLSLDAASLATFPDGCRHLVYLQSRGGASITPHLPVPGSAALARLEAESAAWLAGESASSAC
ncbi:MAG TPA: nuclear transport factor 2 family protein [Ramlibacter sp.]|nr:nuclear transport factor 2 family protein [Ramlibacter sp.]